MTKSLYFQQWFSNPRRDLLAGLVVALALIPEALAFAFIAGVDPQVALYASFCIAVTIAFVGGRPAMISAATGAMALLMVTLVREHGLNYLFAATLLTGVLQIVAGVCRLGGLMKFVSRSVVIGFVNALAILIFMAQLPEFRGQGWLMYAMVAAGLGIIYGFPRITKAVPSALVCIVALTALSMGLQLDVRTVGDIGILPSTLPVFSWPIVPLTWETLMIILPYSLPLAVVGLLESLMTATILDNFTGTESNKNVECAGQGIANLVAGCFGGMAGCAMIGQSVINVKSGGRGRLSTFAAGVILLGLLVLLGPWVKQIPVPALVAVMIMVSVGTFSWASLRNLRVYPKSASIVTFTVVAVVVGTHNLALGVGVGVLLSALFFAAKVAKLLHVTTHRVLGTNERVYHVRGQLFFVSASAFERAFDFAEPMDKVTLDVTHAHFWDVTSIDALDKTVDRFRSAGVDVEVVGLNAQSQAIVERLAIYDKPDAHAKTAAH